jgi:hypothetical protein
LAVKVLAAERRCHFLFVFRNPKTHAAPSNAQARGPCGSAWRQSGRQDLQAATGDAGGGDNGPREGAELVKNPMRAKAFIPA